MMLGCKRLRANTGIINLHNYEDGVITYFLQSPLLLIRRIPNSIGRCTAVCSTGAFASITAK